MKYLAAVLGVVATVAVFLCAVHLARFTREIAEDAHKARILRERETGALERIADALERKAP